MWCRWDPYWWLDERVSDFKHCTSASVDHNKTAPAYSTVSLLQKGSLWWTGKGIPDSTVLTQVYAKCIWHCVYERILGSPDKMSQMIECGFFRKVYYTEGNVKMSCSVSRTTRDQYDAFIEIVCNFAQLMFVQLCCHSQRIHFLMFIGFKGIQIIGLPRWQSPCCHWRGSE